MRLISRRTLTISTIITTFLVWSIITIKHNYCVEESTCLTSFAYARDTLLQKTGLAFTAPADIESCFETCDRTIVIGHTSREDVSWLGKRLPDWNHAIYNVSTPQPPFEVPKNKGNEAMVYLTYIIDHFHRLPSLILFLHAHENGYRKAWHVDAPLHDQVLSVRSLNLDYIKHQGYVNLRCILRPGCDAGDGGASYNMNVDDWNAIFRNTSTPPRWMALQSQSYQPLMRNDNMLDPTSTDYLAQELPPISATCCAQFAVTRDSILQRPLSDYVAFRTWLQETPDSDLRAGGVFEYLWHIIFGQMAQVCPETKVCRCALYGRC